MKIIITALFCVVYDSGAQNAHTYEQLLKMSVNLGLGFVHLFRFSILCVFMATLWNRAGRYIFILWFLLSFFFSCLFSAVAYWMSAILLHVVWP